MPMVITRDDGEQVVISWNGVSRSSEAIVCHSDGTTSSGGTYGEDYTWTEIAQTIAREGDQVEINGKQYGRYGVQTSNIPTTCPRDT